jgi:hypothetical protein
VVQGKAAPKPAHQDKKATHKEFEELHTAVAPAGVPIPIHVTPTTPPPQGQMIDHRKRKK